MKFYGKFYTKTKKSPTRHEVRFTPFLISFNDSISFKQLGAALMITLLIETKLELRGTSAEMITGARQERVTIKQNFAVCLQHILVRRSPTLSQVPTAAHREVLSSTNVYFMINTVVWVLESNAKHSLFVNLDKIKPALAPYHSR